MSAPASQLRPGLAPRGARILTVWEVCQRIQHQLQRDEALQEAWVRGEVSNVRRYPSGHLYFTLKDADAQLNAMMWAEDAQRLRFDLRDGLAVLAHGRVALYLQRGSVQLYVDEVHPDGAGRLHLAFEQLKERLGKEGLFDAARKRPLPRFPGRIGIVTSPQGAALQDMLRVLRQRGPLAEVVVAAARVQGDGAALEVAAAIQRLNRLDAADVLIVGRGGGSLEDLWAFNEEPVARAIAASRIPVVSAVGHETDVTIADFVADARAPTPTAAAAMVGPDARDLARSLDALETRARRRASTVLEASASRLAALEARAALRRPDRLLEAWRQRLAEAAWRLDRAAERRVDHAGERMAHAGALLHSYSPLRTLERGYAIVTVHGRPAASVARLAPGTEAEVRVADGTVRVVTKGG